MSIKELSSLIGQLGEVVFIGHAWVHSYGVGGAILHIGVMTPLGS